MKLILLATLVAVAFADNDGLSIIKEAHSALLRELNSPKVAAVAKQHANRVSELASLSDFEAYLNRHGKNYAEEEKQTRLRHYQVNMWIAKMLQLFERGTAKYGETPFSDMSLNEFKKMKNNGVRWTKTGFPTTLAEIATNDAIPDSIDWREKGAVTPVKNQEQCGSCWAFSTTGNIEGQWFLKKNKLVSLSEQELVDCDTVDQGCNGGLPSQAYDQIIKLGGLETEDEYPYEARDDQCKFKKSDAAVYINSSVSLPEDETKIAEFVATKGPVSIGINAFAMQFYMGGVSHPWSMFCNPNNLDHGVLIVGYGTEKDTPYWIVKNSWGPGWGEKGYYRVFRGAGVCGLNKMVTSAVVA